MSAPEAIPICRRCLHFDYFTLRCVRGKREVGVDPVDGASVHHYAVLESASEQRAGGLFSFTRCGPKGRHFQSK